MGTGYGFRAHPVGYGQGRFPVRQEEGDRRSGDHQGA